MEEPSSRYFYIFLRKGNRQTTMTSKDKKKGKWSRKLIDPFIFIIKTRVTNSRGGKNWWKWASGYLFTNFLRFIFCCVYIFYDFLTLEHKDFIFYGLKAKTDFEHKGEKKSTKSHTFADFFRKQINDFFLPTYQKFTCHSTHTLFDAQSVGVRNERNYILFYCKIN